MIISPLLFGLLFGATAFFSVYFFSEKRTNKPDMKAKWFCGVVFMIVGIIIGLAVASSVGSLIADKCLAKNEIRIIEKHELAPFHNNSGAYAYMIADENKVGKKVIWYLENGELRGLLGNNRDKLFDKGRTIFSNDDFPNRQVVRPFVGAFWKYFVIVYTTERFVIPPGGLQEGSFKTIYEFVPRSPKSEQ